ncbi:MliC family protein [Acetobacteraceae bacterium ESL0709]|nr:MliC family protein [Acetobacteraceae bacterium ESL0697]MDF7677293.1 MliC family protein [Acetobacteraceae bacterium ESL0709]
MRFLSYLTLKRWSLSVLAASVWVLWGASAFTVHAAEKTVPVPRNQFQLEFAPDEVAIQQSRTYNCVTGAGTPTEAQKALLASLPADRKVTVTYVSADIASLAIMPVDGKMLVLANVMSADGAKYVADRYIWWSRGDKAFFSRSDDEKGGQLDCQIAR